MAWFRVIKEFVGEPKRASGLEDTCLPRAALAQAVHVSILPLPSTVMYTRYIRKYRTAVDVSPSLVQRTHFGRAKDSKGSVGLVYLGLG